MAFIIETPNPFEPLVGLRKHTHPGGISIWDWLRQTYPGFTEFAQPTICLVNGIPTLRKDWDTVIKSEDIINFIAVVGEVVTIIAIVIAVLVIAASIALALTMPSPVTPGELPASDPVFSTKGQTNAIRLGEPIEVNYGRNRIFPSLAARPFFKYIDNDQYQHSLFCIGQGVYDVEAIQIGDTSIDTFAEVQYELLPPGTTTTLFHTNIYTSPEAGGQELIAPNDATYVDPGWVGPFAACPPGSEVFRIELDFVYPKGVYTMSGKGKLDSVTITTEAEAREIDDLGNPIGDWFTLLSYTITGTTTTPQRRTVGEDLSAVGRYEVRARRTSITSTGIKYGHDVSWEGLRGFVYGTEPEYGDLTLLAVRIRATNNLNSRTQERFNVIATRKLPIRESGGTWGDPVATRSVVWAFVDVFRSLYGGRISEDKFFDWDALEDLDALYESRGEHFDWTFRDPITIWDGAKAVALVGRAVPLLVGSLITMRRDGPLEVPVSLFTPDNITKGSFQWEIKLWEPEEHDSVSIEYTEVATGYKQEQVLCILPGDTGDNPQDVRLPGVQDRNHAYRQGLYILASRRYLRENISFETGMEGFLPSFGDLIAVSHDVPRWGQSGYILAVTDLGGNSYELHVSEPLLFEESGIYQMMLRDKQGGIIGPVDVEETSDPKRVVVTIIGAVDFLLGGQTEPMIFLFGLAGQVTKYGRVVKMEPQGGERVKITIVNEASVVHSFDDLVAPPLTFPSLPPVVPDLPVIAELHLNQIYGEVLTVQAGWTAAFGAQYYIIQVSEDGENWREEATTTRTSLQFAGWIGTVYVRVAAVNNGQGPWIQDSIDLGHVLGLFIYKPWTLDDLDWGVRWWANPNVDGWQVKVYDNSGSEPVLRRVTQLAADVTTFDYTYADAVADSNLSREIHVCVDSMTLVDSEGTLEADGLPSCLDLENPLPAPPDESSLGYDFISYVLETHDASYRLFWTNPVAGDTVRIRVWLSAVSGFDPEVETPVLDYTSGAPGFESVPVEAFVDIVLGADNVHNDYYWRIAVNDVWGSDYAITDEQVIAPEWILLDAEWEDKGRWRDEQTWNDS